MFFCQFQKACIEEKEEENKLKTSRVLAFQFIHHVQGCHKENNIKICSRSSTTSSSVMPRLVVMIVMMVAVPGAYGLLFPFFFYDAIW